MEKTLKEWLEGLPEPYRSQALEEMKGNPDSLYKNPERAVAGAFVWADSSQGHEYWSNFHDTL